MAKEVNKKDNKKEEKVAKKSSKTTKNTKSVNNTSTMRDELKKVTWPTKKELVNSTMAVIVIVIITAIIVFVLDLAFESLNTFGINKLRTTISEKVNKNEVTTTQDAQEEVVTDDTDTENEESDITEGEVDNATTETPTTTEE